MDLFIDTTRMDMAVFGVELGGRVKKSAYLLKPYEGHKILLKLGVFLKKYNINMSKIRKIVVSKGPGSFVGTRVGLSVALALGFGLGIKVKAISGIEMEKYLRPNNG